MHRRVRERIVRPQDAQLTLDLVDPFAARDERAEELLEALEDEAAEEDALQ
jgi:hypothetical protein